MLLIDDHHLSPMIPKPKEGLWADGCFLTGEIDKLLYAALAYLYQQTHISGALGIHNS